MCMRTRRKGADLQKLALFRPVGVAKVHAFDHSRTRFVAATRTRDDSYVIPKRAQTTTPLGLLHDQAFSGVQLQSRGHHREHYCQ